MAKTENRDEHIACPKCYWEPDGFPYWQCKCGHVWNTFETRGRCPSCGHQWKTTWCIDFAGGCGQPSPHEAWYHDLLGWWEEELSKLNQPVEAVEE